MTLAVLAVHIMPGFEECKILSRRFFKLTVLNQVFARLEVRVFQVFLKGFRAALNIQRCCVEELNSGCQWD